MKYNRILAVIVTAVMIAAAILLGLPSRPVSRDGSLYVTDRAGVLSDSTVREFVAEQQGAPGRLSVALVRSTGKLSTADYCEALWNKWRLGSSDLLLLMVTGRQDYYFGYDVNSAMAPTLDSAYQQLLDRYLEPDFAVGDYDAAILAFSDGVQAVLADGWSYDESYAPYYYPESSGMGFGTIFILIIVVVLIVAVISASSIGRRRRGATVYRAPRRTVIIPPPRPMNRPMSRPSRPVSRPSSRPSSSFGGMRRSRGGFGGSGRSSGSFGGGGRSSGFGGGGRSGGFGGGGRGRK